MNIVKSQIEAFKHSIIKSEFDLDYERELCINKIAIYIQDKKQKELLTQEVNEIYFSKEIKPKTK